MIADKKIGYAPNYLKHHIDLVYTILIIIAFSISGVEKTIMKC